MDQLNNKGRTKKSGFTLVELSVVLAIVGILTIGSITLFKEQKVNVEQDTTAGKLETVKVALLTFIEKNNYLPCPDANVKNELGFGLESRELNQSTTLPEVAANFGRPAEAATALQPFIPAVLATPLVPERTVSVDTCTVSSGTVPFEVLGLSLQDVTGANYNLFRYEVSRGVTVASNMANCPVDSACFFNRNSIPAFDYTTEPVAGSLGVNNLRVCSEVDCSGENLLNDGLISVLLAYNQNANNSVSGLSAGEQENRNGDKTFVKSQYVANEGGAYFDDLLVSISGSELKRGDMKTFQQNSVVGGGVSPPPPQAPALDIDDLGAGSSGTNIGSDPATWDRVSQVFDFGVAAANREVVLTYSTYTVGAWDQPSGGFDNTTADTGTVSSNDDTVQVYNYDHEDNNFDGVVEVTFVAGGTGTYTLTDIYDQYGNNINKTVTAGVEYTVYQPYWNDTAEIILTADEYGQIDLEFAVGTTATVETIDFTGIELVYYDTPSPIPNFPSVEPVSGITQTEGL